jgi:hypothetical protein
MSMGIFKEAFLGVIQMRLRRVTEAAPESWAQHTPLSLGKLQLSMKDSLRSEMF